MGLNSTCLRLRAPANKKVQANCILNGLGNFQAVLPDGWHHLLTLNKVNTCAHLSWRFFVGYYLPQLNFENIFFQ